MNLLLIESQSAREVTTTLAVVISCCTNSVNFVNVMPRVPGYGCCMVGRDRDCVAISDCHPEIEFSILRSGIEKFVILVSLDPFSGLDLQIGCHYSIPNEHNYVCT